MEAFTTAEQNSKCHFLSVAAGSSRTSPQLCPPKKLRQQWVGEGAKWVNWASRGNGVGRLQERVDMAAMAYAGSYPLFHKTLYTLSLHRLVLAAVMVQA